MAKLFSVSVKRRNKNGDISSKPAVVRAIVLADSKDDAYNKFVNEFTKYADKVQYFINVSVASGEIYTF